MDTAFVRGYYGKGIINANTTVVINSSDAISAGILVIGIRSNITGVLINGIPAINKGNQCWYLPNPPLLSDVSVIISDTGAGWGGYYAYAIYVLSYANGFAGCGSMSGYAANHGRIIASCPSMAGGMAVGIGSSGNYIDETGFMEGLKSIDWTELGADGRINYRIEHKTTPSVGIIEEYYWGTFGDAKIPPDQIYITLNIAAVYHGTAIKAVSNDEYSHLKKVAGVEIAAIKKIGGLS